MDLSVCIVTYRSRDTIVECLESVLAEQAALSPPPGGGLDVIVVDNASDDGTEDTVRDRFPEIVLIDNLVNAGFARAANQAIRRAKGRYVLLLNPDVVVQTGTLAGMVRAMDENPRVGAIGPRLLTLDGRVQGSCGYFPTRVEILARALGAHRWLARLPRFRGSRSLAYFAYPEDVAEVDGVLGSFLMVRREVLDEVGLLDESYFLYGEDIDWCRRARAKGVKINYDPRFSAVHGQGASAAARPLASLAHFYISAARYHLVHEAPASGPLVSAIALAGLAVRAALAVGLHLLGIRHASRIFLRTRPPRSRGCAGKTWP